MPDIFKVYLRLDRAYNVHRLGDGRSHFLVIQLLKAVTPIIVQDTQERIIAIEQLLPSARRNGWPQSRLRKDIQRRFDQLAFEVVSSSAGSCLRISASPA